MIQIQIGWLADWLAIKAITISIMSHVCDEIENRGPRGTKQLKSENQNEFMTPWVRDWKPFLARPASIHSGHSWPSAVSCCRWLCWSQSSISGQSCCWTPASMQGPSAGWPSLVRRSPSDSHRLSCPLAGRSQAHSATLEGQPLSTKHI